MLLQPFQQNYQPHSSAKDYEILGKALAFAMDVNDAIRSDQNTSAYVIHKTAGPPYEPDEPKLPNFTVKKKKKSNKPKRKKIPNLTPTFQPQIPTYQPEITTKKPAQNRVRNRLRRQKLKQKIIEELQQLELEREDDLNQKLQFNLYNDISNNIMDRRTSGFFNQITGDLSLSRKDFIFQLTTWFRRSIWFLGFTAAYTVSPTLLGIAVILSLLFELALNMDVIRNEMNAFMYDFSRRSEPFLNDPISTLTRLLYPEQPMYSNHYNYYNVF